MSSSSEEPGSHAGPGTAGLVIGALGIVYGDIGTSPLYALKECFSPEVQHRVAVTTPNVLGVLSLVFWALMLVVTVKYLTFVMKADNEGSGGILALLALVPARITDVKKRTSLIVMLVLFGAALLYGDGVITPAISVLSAVEGLEVATSTMKPLVVPITCAVLFGLFMVQSRGTAKVGRLFGPIMIVWFLMIAGFGIPHILANPGVLWAVDPRYAMRFFLENHWHGFLVLGAVVLCITGGEALYADMGHFGRTPIRLSWLGLVWPCLLLNYFGQGALLLRDAEAAKSPFYALVPSWALYPTVAVATMATVIASQALISGAYSLTQQAISLGYFPRCTIIHTSKDVSGQIYIPEVNYALLVLCLVLVLAFGSSTNLAAAYGIAVTGTMGITTIVYWVVLRETWGWPLWRASLLAGSFLVVDLAFFGANAVKIAHGGWVPLAMATALFAIMTTWKAGRRELALKIRADMLPFDIFMDDVRESKPHRVKGTAVFMASAASGTPPVLLHHFKHNQVLHKTVILLSIETMRVPEVAASKRLEVIPHGEGVYRIIARYGFMEAPNVPTLLAQCAELGVPAEPGSTSYYLGRETLLASGQSKMAHWRKGLFAFISRNARSATAYFGLPPNRVVELGMQVDL